MAKYVGKIFRSNNNLLGIHKAGSHFVHVKWYNPFKRHFYCKVLTSLSENVTANTDKEKRNLLKGKIVYKLADTKYQIIDRKNITLIKEGNVEPISQSRLINFKNWTGYSKNVILNKNDLISDNDTHKMKILEAKPDKYFKRKKKGK